MDLLSGTIEGFEALTFVCGELFAGASGDQQIMKFGVWPKRRHRNALREQLRR